MTLAELLSQIETLLARHPEYGERVVLVQDQGRTRVLLTIEGRTMRLE